MARISPIPHVPGPRHTHTHTCRTSNCAPQALPITQHSPIWPLYLRFLGSHLSLAGPWRFLQLSPESAEERTEYLKSSNRLDEATQCLAAVVEDERLVSEARKSNYQLWHELCDLISHNPDQVQPLNMGRRAGRGRPHPTSGGKLWCLLPN